MRTNVTMQFRFRERKCMETKRPGTENETSIIRNAVGFASMRRC